MPSPDLKGYLGSFSRRVLPEALAASTLATAALLTHPDSLDQGNSYAQLSPTRPRPPRAFNDQAFSLQTLYAHDCADPLFKKTIMKLLKEKKRPISVPQAVECFRGKNNLLYDFNCFIVSVDDGWRSNYEAGLPTLEAIRRETGIFVPAAFYILTKFGNPTVPFRQVDDSVPSFNDGDPKHIYVTKGQAKQMVKWHENGDPSNAVYVDSHTVNHANLASPKLSEGDILGELRSSFDIINGIYQEAQVEKRCSTLAYPEGGVNERVQNIIRLNCPFIEVAFTIADATPINIRNRPIVKDTIFQTPSESLSLIRWRLN